MVKRKSRSGPPQRISAVLEQLRASGARLKTGASATARDIAALERKLGFVLPASYREFLGALGEVRVNDWRFYGVTGAGARNKTYAREFAAGDGGVTNGGPYFSKRFIVLCDQGEYSNAGAGWVFDADLGAMLATDGGRWIEREDTRDLDYWDWLAEQLAALHAQVAAEHAAETQRVRNTAALTTTASRDGTAEAKHLYAAFEKYEKATRWHCQVAKCKQCVTSNRAFDSKPLRKLTAKELEHYVGWALEGDVSTTLLPKAQPARQRAFKHFLPRCLELIGDLGCHEILRERKIFARGFLSAEERQAVDAWLAHYWRVMLQSAATLSGNVTILLRCVPELAPYLATWEASTHASAQRLRAQCAEDLKGSNSLLRDNCLNGDGSLQRRAKEIARWISLDGALDS